MSEDEILNSNDFTKCLEIIEKNWNTDYGTFEICKEKMNNEITLELTTGGWSDNESFIDKLSQTWFWFLWWQESKRGGYYKFVYSEVIKYEEEENKAIEFIKKEIKNLEEAKIDFSNEIEDKGWLQKNINELDKDIFYKNTILNLIEKLQKENEELKNKVIKRDNDIIYLEETAEKEFLTKQEVKENYIPKNKLKDMLQEIRKKIVITVGDKLNAEKQGNEKEIKAYSNALDVYNAKAVLIEHILAEAKNEKD